VEEAVGRRLRHHVAVTTDHDAYRLIAARRAKRKEMLAMDLRTFSITAGAIFALIALVHLVRIYLGWSIVIDSWSVPMWVSWIGFVVAGGLAYLGLRAMRRQLF
jgi:type VI protein secretion system component VasF